MVPDFDQQRQQPCDRTSSRSLKPTSHKPFGKQKSFQQFNTTRPQPAVSAPFCGVDHTFFHLWLAQPSWCPIVLAEHGWKTVKSPSGKKVPLTLGSIESNYRRGVVIGKRFGKLTNYLMVDVDAESIHHPKNEGLGLIFTALEEIGLCRYLPIQSSDSGGLHLYFPLPTAVNAWALARTVHAAISAAGVHVKNGQCELFPNKKALGSEHHGHRLPLQAGSFILDDDFHPIGNEKAVFLRHWQHCAAGQDETLLTLAFEDRPKVTVDQLRTFPPIAWTAPGQSNDVLRQLVNYGDRVMGLNTIPELGDWMTEIAPRLPGYDRFASAKTKKDLSRRDWAYRWAKSHFKSCWKYAASISLDYNATIAAQAKGRLLAALNELVVDSSIKATNLWKMLSETTQRLYGMGVSWKVFTKYKALVLASVKGDRNLGLSKGSEEGKKVLDLDENQPEESEGSQRGENGPTQLLTPRCVISSHSNELSSFNTPSQRGGSVERILRPIECLRKVDEPDELAMGAEVIIEGSGSALDGVKSRVTGKGTDEQGLLVYRLEYQVDGKPVMMPGKWLASSQEEGTAMGAGAVIKATAAQLLQVLGKACPFVGPGLWTVRRDEISGKAWGQLIKLVGEA